MSSQLKKTFKSFLRSEKSTIPGMIMAFLALFCFALLLNVLYPFISSIISANSTGTNPLLEINIAFVIIGVGLIVWIIKDGLAGSREYEGYGI